MKTSFGGGGGVLSCFSAPDKSFPDSFQMALCWDFVE